ncbi:MAG: fluoride efflux transporter CrcB [Cucumibacter sp.]
MQSILLVGAGGALGAVGRYGAGVAFVRLGVIGFPWATVAINVSGSLLMGVLIGLLAQTLPAWQNEARLFLAVGVLGGYTTFSAFSLDVVTLFERGEILPATLYIAFSVAASILALVFGLLLMRWVLP